MDRRKALKALDSVWTVTDEILKYVADIRTIVIGAKGLVDDFPPSDPPLYENLKPEQLFERLDQKLTCLENLNDERKAILEELSTALTTDDLHERRQIRGIPSEHESVSPRDKALKNLASYTRARQAALKTNLDLLEQTSQRLSEFRNQVGEPNKLGGECNRGCSPCAAGVFYKAMNVSGRFNSHISEDRVKLLSEGERLEKTLLKVPHETNKETSEILRKVQYSYLRIKNANMSTFDVQIAPILKEYLEIQTGSAIKNTANCVLINMQHSFNQYTQMVQAYSQALQSLADHLVL